ncbi:MAG: STAS domain-containing protein [Clostridia bacterium]|nr:STAS domain-containing protein [Clostridia bacterium]
MTINVEKNGSELTVAIQGRLDTMTAPQLDEQLKKSYEGATKLILDLKDLEYISSAGLRVLLSAHKVMSKQGDMVITNANSTVMEVFEITGFSDILHIQ